MATDLTLYLDDEPGELARVGDVLGKVGANIAGLCALTTGGGQAEVHILVQDATLAFEALQNAGIKIAAEEEVIVLDVEDRPGALGEVARKLGNANMNLTTVHPATNTPAGTGLNNLADARSRPCADQRSSQPYDGVGVAGVGHQVVVVIERTTADRVGTLSDHVAWMRTGLRL